MCTPLDTVYILFGTYFVCVKVRELFEVTKLGGTLYIVTLLTGLRKFANLMEAV
jgi:hypothetical protein